jgi:hypothetical protein
VRKQCTGRLWQQVEIQVQLACVELKLVVLQLWDTFGGHVHG